MKPGYYVILDMQLEFTSHMHITSWKQRVEDAKNTNSNAKIQKIARELSKTIRIKYNWAFPVTSVNYILFWLILQPYLKIRYFLTCLLLASKDVIWTLLGSESSYQLVHVGHVAELLPDSVLIILSEPKGQNGQLIVKPLFVQTCVLKSSYSHIKWPAQSPTTCSLTLHESGWQVTGAEGGNS